MEHEHYEDRLEEQEPEPVAGESPETEARMSNYMPPVKPRHVLGVLLRILLVLVALAIVAFGIYWWATHHKSAAPAASSGAQHAQQNQQQPTASLINPKTTHYDSTNYGLGFDYPADWTVSDKTDSPLTVTSPTLQLTDSSGQNTPAQIVLTIQNKQSKVKQFAAGTAIAPLQSQKLTYKHPTQDQRAQTYLTFVNYSGDTSAIDALYITGDNGYQAAQGIPEKDMTQDDPLISLSFLQCSDTNCSSTSALSISTDSWSDTRLSTPLINLLESLSIN